MSYRFELSDRDIEQALRRIADEQFTAALKAVSEGGPLPSRVHEMRKSVKKLRGLIRLVRPAFKGFGRENDALREAARGLTVLREADVNVKTLESLLPEVALAAEDAQTLRDAIARLPAEGLDAHAATEDALDIFRDRMSALRARAASWRLQDDGFDAIAGGLERTWAQACRRMEPALADPSAEAVHEWRKRVKDHWYQARLLSPIWPEAMAPHVTTADRLGEALGDHHDLAVLVDILKPLKTKAAKTVSTLARKRQKTLIRAAGADARRLFADRAPCLVDRWRQWWRVWRG
jgi:CHAD domain-containing protein